MEGFIWGAVGGLAALILKDLYETSKTKIKKIRDPRIEVKGNDGLIRIVYKPYRWYHKKTPTRIYPD